MNILECFCRKTGHGVSFLLQVLLHVAATGDKVSADSATAVAASTCTSDSGDATAAAALQNAAVSAASLEEVRCLRRRAVQKISVLLHCRCEPAAAATPSTTSSTAASRRASSDGRAPQATASAPGARCRSPSSRRGGAAQEWSAGRPPVLRGGGTESDGLGGAHFRVGTWGKVYSVRSHTL